MGHPIDERHTPDEKDQAFANGLMLLLPEIKSDEPAHYGPNGSITQSVVRCAARGNYRFCGYPTTKEMEAWPPFFLEERYCRHLLPAIRALWNACYATT